MTYTESNTKIYFTTDYSLFRMINGNRELNATKIKRIQKEISGGLDVLKYCPILVSNDGKIFKIIDGQHRFWVAKQLKKPVHFVIIEKDIDLYSIAKINSNTETWKPKDFINCYAQQGNEHYLQLRDFLDTWGFNIGMSIKLLLFGAPSDGGFATDINGMFKEGRFKVKTPQEATEIAKTCKLFEKFASWRTRLFVTAIHKIVKSGKCDIEELADKCNKFPEMLTVQPSYKDYLNSLEAIYNKGTHKRRVIY